MAKKITCMFFIMVSGLFLAGVTANAGPTKERMKNRLPIIIELKAQGIVGENNQGYLEVMPGKDENKDVVHAENMDRRKVYEAIAKQQGTTAALVGRRRAIQISEKAKPGEWLQNADGKWYQKQ